MFDKSGFLIGGGYVDKLRVIRKGRGFEKDSLKSVLSDLVRFLTFKKV